MCDDYESLLRRDNNSASLDCRSGEVKRGNRSPIRRQSPPRSNITLLSLTSTRATRALAAISFISVNNNRLLTATGRGPNRSLHSSCSLARSSALVTAARFLYAWILRFG